MDLTSPVRVCVLAPALAGIGVALGADYQADWRALRVVDTGAVRRIRLARAGWVGCLTVAMGVVAGIATTMTDNAALLGPVLCNTALFGALALAATAAGHAEGAFLPPLALLGIAMLLGRDPDGDLHWWAQFLSTHVSAAQVVVVSALWLASATWYTLALRPALRPALRQAQRPALRAAR